MKLVVAVMTTIRILLPTAPIFAKAPQEARDIYESPTYANERRNALVAPKYQLRFSFDESSEFFAGQAEIRFGLKPGHLTTQVWLDFADAMISELRLNGESVDIKKAYNGRRILLAAGLLKTEDNLVMVRYQRSFTTKGPGLYRHVDLLDQQVYVYSNLLPHGAHFVFPCFDQQDLRGVFELRVDAPLSWKVIAPTAAIKKTRSPHKQFWTFATTPLVNIVAFDLHAGPFNDQSVQIGPQKLQIFFRKSTATAVSSAEWQTLGRYALKFFQDYFGSKGPNQINIVAKPEAGSAEAQVLNQALLEDRNEGLTQQLSFEHAILSDIAWYWFGKEHPSSTVSAQVYSRALADYLAYLAGRTRVASSKAIWDWFYFNQIKAPLYKFDRMSSTSPPQKDNGPRRLIEEFNSNLPLLRHRSNALFKQIDATPNAAHLQKRLKTFLGDPNLFWPEQFFAALPGFEPVPESRFQRPGYPKVQLNWNCEKAKLTKAFAQGSYFKDPGFDDFTFSLNLSIFDFNPGGGLTLRRNVFAPTVNADQVDIGIVNADCPFFIAANLDDASYSRQVIPSSETAHAVVVVQKNPNQLSQSVLLHDMFLDFVEGKWTANDLLANFLVFIQDERITFAALALVEWILDYRGGPSYLTVVPETNSTSLSRFKQLYAQWEDAIAKRALTKSPLQSAWFNAWINFVATPAGLARLRQHYDQAGKSLVRIWSPRRRELVNQVFLAAGLPVDIKLNPRYDILRPDESTKSNYFKQLTTASKPHLSHDKQLEIIHYLFPRTQWELHKKFVDQFYNFLPQATVQMDDYVLNEFIQHLTPVFCGEADQVRLSKFMTRNPQLPAWVLALLSQIWVQNSECIRARALFGTQSETL